MGEESASGRYRCHVCAQAVNPVAELVDFKCPRCNDGFIIEHFEEDDDGLPPPETSPTNIDNATAERERPSVWAPILFATLAGNPENRTGGVGPTAVILINPLNQPLTFRGSDNNDSSAIGSDTFGDYFLGQGMEQLLQHLAENDPNRHGTPPAQKSAVEAMPTVSAEEGTACTVCLEEIGIGETAREMPCKHRFHGGCILPWLELHSSCPVCRFQMPVEEEEKDTTGSSSRGEEGDGMRFSQWFDGLFSLLSMTSYVVESSESEGNSNSQSQDN